MVAPITLEVPQGTFDLLKRELAAQGRPVLEDGSIDLSNVRLTVNRALLQNDWEVNSTHAVAVGYGEFMDISSAPKSVKVQLLNQGGVACYGQWDGRSFSSWRGWHPLPRVPKWMRDSNYMYLNCPRLE